MSDKSQTDAAGSKEVKSIIPLGSRGIQLATFDELYRFSDFVVRAGIAPKSIDTAEKVFLVLQYSLEMGFSPMIGLQNAMIVNNRVSYWGELVVAQIEAHPEFEDLITEYFGDSGPELTCKVTVKRKGRTPSVGTFSIREAQHLINDPSKASTWGKYPRRMLFWRAFTKAKIIFADALKGISMPTDFDDAPDIKDAKVTEVVTITKPVFNENKGQAEPTVPTEPDDRQRGINDPSVGESIPKEKSEVQPTQERAREAIATDLQGDSAPDVPAKPEPPKTKNGAGAKADKLLRLINKANLTSTAVVDFIGSFDYPLGAAKTTGIVHDLPEASLTVALQQWETIRHSLSKKSD